MTGVAAGWLRVILFLVLLTPLITSFDPFPATVYPFVVSKAAFSRILIALGFVLWCWLAWWEPALRPRWDRSWALGALGLYLAVGLAAALLGEAPTRSLWSGYERMTGWVHQAHMAVWCLMLVSVFRTWGQWLRLLQGAGLVALLVGLLGFMAQGSWAAWLEPYWPVSGRASVTLGNPTYAGGFAAVAVFLGLGLAGWMGVWRRSAGGAIAAVGPVLWWLVAAALLLMLLWWSGTRGALLAFGGGLVVLGLALAWRPLSRWWRAVGVMLAALSAAGVMGAVVLAFSGSGVGESLRSGLTQYRPESVASRLALADIAWRGFLERPVLGWGGENFRLAHQRLAPPEPRGDGSRRRFDRAHSAPLEELVSGGLPGFLAWLGFWAAVFWAAVRGVRRLRGGWRLLAAGSLAGLTAHFVQGLFLFDAVATLPQFYLLAAFAVFCAGRGRAGEPVRLPDRLRNWTERRRRAAGLSATSLLMLLGLGGLWLAGAAPLTGARLVMPVLDVTSAPEAAVEGVMRSSRVYGPGAVDGGLWFSEWASANWDYLDAGDRDTVMKAVAGRLERAAALDPGNVEIAVGLGAVYQYQAGAGVEGRNYDALAWEQVRRALRLAPESVEAVYLYLVQLTRERGPGYGLAALELYLERRPGAWKALDGLHYRLTSAVELGEDGDGLD